MSAESIRIPEPIFAKLVETIERCWFAPSPNATAALEALPAELPEGEVQLLASGGGFGMYIEARIDRVDGRIALECFSHNRMSGDSYDRIWEDGSRESVPVQPASGAQELDVDKAALARGFMQFTTEAREINRYLRGWS